MPKSPSGGTYARRNAEERMKQDLTVAADTPASLSGLDARLGQCTARSDVPGAALWRGRCIKPAGHDGSHQNPSGAQWAESLLRPAERPADQVRDIDFAISGIDASREFFVRHVAGKGERSEQDAGCIAVYDRVLATLRALRG